MGRKFVKITLAAKCRVLFGAAVILIIGAALVVPWLYMNAMVDEEARRAGGEVTRLYLNEWTAKHPDGLKADQVARLFTDDDESTLRTGPLMLRVGEDQRLLAQGDTSAKPALKYFLRNSDEELWQVVNVEGGRRQYRTYMAVRAVERCMACHGDQADPRRQLKPSALVGIVRADLPGEQSITSLGIVRLVIIAAGVLAFLLATLTFYFITTRLILSPVRKLKKVADRVAEGDLTVRSEIRTGDEFEQLGHSFDEMLASITETQNQLRTANRALDLRLNELAESNTALYESNRLKSEFLANVSHELRTPLNSIIGFAELLGDSVDEKVQRYSGNILTSARMLLRIINDLLDLARIEAGKAQLTVTRASVADICETLISLVTPLATKKNLQLSLEVHGDLPAIETDAGKVQQVLYNLLSNAIKFTPAGGSVKMLAWAQDSTVSISVADTGPGISEAEQAHIFEKFHQLDPAVTKEHGGAGLGLAIVKELLGLLGGRMDLMSEPGKGATFTMTLPLAIPQSAEKTAGS